MNIIELKSFLALVEFRSISLAAKKLHITQSAMSKRVQKLEDELHAQLFIVTKHSTRLTEKGQTFVPYARQIVHVYDEMKLNMDNSLGMPASIINIAGSVYISSYLMTNFINYVKSIEKPLKFNSLTIHEREVEENLYQSVADIIVCATQKIPKQIATGSLWKEQLYFVVAKTHPLAKEPKEVTLNELAQYPAILPEKGFYIRDQIDLLFEQHGLNLILSAEASLILVNAQMISSGAGWGVIYKRLVNDNFQILNIEPTVHVSFSWHCLEKRLREKPIQEVIASLEKWAQQIS